MIYFDSAATTNLDQEVLQSYATILNKYFENADSLHDAGVKVSQLMEKSREQIASCLKVNSDELIFTSGSSESNNLAIKGAAFQYQRRGKHLITSCIEHSSVSATMKQLEEHFGFEVTYLPVDARGCVRKSDLLKALREDTILVSIMAINNEIGSINDIAELADAVHQNSRAFFHSDCTQILGKYPIDFSKLDLASCSAHKIHGCKGSGFLYKKRNIGLLPLICGGQQEQGLRGGTSNAPCNIVLAKTVRLALQKQEQNLRHAKELNAYLRELLSSLKGEVEINSPIDGSSFILNFSFVHLTSEVMQNALNSKGFCVSALSTCSSKSRAVSKVLMAMGFSENRAGRSIRVSFSSMNNKQEVELLFKAIKEVLKDYGV